MRALLLLVLSLPSAAFATSSGVFVPASVRIFYSPTAGESCEITNNNTVYYVNDTTGDFASTCAMAMLARIESQQITVDYTLIANTPWANGAYDSSPTGSVSWIENNNYVVNSYADQCSIRAAGVTSYVDDGFPEEDITCDVAYMALYGGRTFTVTRFAGSSEVSSVLLQ